MACEFKDINGKVWTLPKILNGHLRRIKERFGVDCYQNAPDGKNTFWIGRIIDEADTAGTILHFLLEKDIESLKLSPDEFADLFDRECFNDARGAIIEAILSFTKSPAIAVSVRQSLVGEIKKAFDEALRKLQQNNSSGNSQ